MWEADKFANLIQDIFDMSLSVTSVFEGSIQAVIMTQNEIDIAEIYTSFTSYKRRRSDERISLMCM